ncbi:MAG: PspA/IM30 family protein [Myxococcota bacterium]
MGFFSRLINLISGLFGNFVSSVEEQNPEAVYESAIQQRKQQYQELKKASSQIIYLRDKTQKELDEKKNELEQVALELDYAVEHNEDAAAMELISLQEELAARVETLTVEMQGISTQADQAMASMQEFQGEIKKLQREKSQMLAEKASAEAQIAINEQLSGLSIEADMQALDNVRESIHRKKAEAKMNSELNENSADAQLKRIRAKVGAGRNAAKLAELKRRKAAASGEGDAAETTSDSDIAAKLAAYKAKREANNL